MDRYRRSLGPFRTVTVSTEVWTNSQRVAHLQVRSQYLISGTDPRLLPVRVDVLGEMLYALFYSGVHGLLDLLKRKNWWAIYSRIRLFRLGSLFEEVHNLLELVLGTLVGRIPLPV